MKFKKVLRCIRFGVLVPKLFIILFGLFFSSLAFAANLKVNWVDGLIPGGNIAHDTLTCTSSRAGTALEGDRTQNPMDVIWSDDGSTVFTVNSDNHSSMNSHLLSMNKVADPFKVSTDLMTSQGEDVTCDAIDGENPSGMSGGQVDDELENIVIKDDGKIFYILGVNGTLGKFNAATAFDLDGMTYEDRLVLSSTINSVAFNKEGTKVYTLDGSNNTPILTTLELPAAHDFSSSTQIHQVDLSTLGIEVDTTANDTDEQAKDVEFSEDGLAMFVLISNANKVGAEYPHSYIYQFRLDKSFDVSTAVKVGRWNVEGFGNITYNTNKTGFPTGFSFSPDGMMLFMVQMNGGAGVDQVNRFNLECPYGVVECVSVTASVVSTTVELAKQNISINTTTIFRRFEWIKRNRDEENLSAHNINIDYKNPLLEALANKFEPNARKNIASLISNTNNEQKKSKWSSWSVGDIYVGKFGQHGHENPKDLSIRGITFGADRKYGDNKFFGLALRYGESSSDIKKAKQDVSMESLTLNLYGIAPTDENQYVNAVFGVSFLNIDHIYQSKLSGERNGKQAFTSINFRTKNKFSKFNITPTGKFDFGVTQLSEVTDLINNPNDTLAKNIIYKKDTFQSGELAAGFLFEMDKYITEAGSLQPMGGLELLYDITPDNSYKYIYHGETHVTEDIIRKYTNKNLKYNIGFEMIYLNGLTVSSYFEKIMSIKKSGKSKSDRDTFIFKISRSKEEDDQFAFNYNPLNHHQSTLSYQKNINGLNYSINHNQIFENSLEHDTNIEVSSTF